VQASIVVLLGQALIALQHLKKPLASHVVTHAPELETIDGGDGDFGQAKDNIPFFKVPPERLRFCAVGNVSMHMEVCNYAANGQNFNPFRPIDRIKLPGRKLIGIRP
jgi:hypothetical protein